MIAKTSFFLALSVMTIFSCSFESSFAENSQNILLSEDSFRPLEHSGKSDDVVLSGGIFSIPRDILTQEDTTSSKTIVSSGGGYHFAPTPTPTPTSEVVNDLKDLEESKEKNIVEQEEIVFPKEDFLNEDNIGVETSSEEISSKEEGGESNKEGLLRKFPYIDFQQASLNKLDSLFLIGRNEIIFPKISEERPSVIAPYDMCSLCQKEDALDLFSENISLFLFIFLGVFILGMCIEYLIYRTFFIPSE